MNWIKCKQNKMRFEKKWYELYYIKKKKYRKAFHQYLIFITLT